MAYSQNDSIVLENIGFGVSKNCAFGAQFAIIAEYVRGLLPERQLTR